MPARQQLNSAYFRGSALVAGVVGVLSSSWTVFFVVLGLLLVANILGDQIRLTKRGQ